MKEKIKEMMAKALDKMKSMINVVRRAIARVLKAIANAIHHMGVLVDPQPQKKK